MAGTALITGASYGIGYELARLFANDGINLVLTARSSDKLETAKESLRQEYAIEVETFPGDLSEAQTIDNLYHEIEQKGLAIDYLVNNAGLGSVGAFSELSWEKEATMIDLNIRALTHLTKLFLPGMIARNRGRILNVASTAAFQPGPLMSVYYATKHYVLAFSEGLDEELNKEPVTVTTLCPGPVKTGFQDNAEMGNIRLFRLPGVKTPDQVALYGYTHMQKGKRLAIPGFNNKFTAFMTRFLPRSWAMKVAKSLHQS